MRVERERRLAEGSRVIQRPIVRTILVTWSVIFFACAVIVLFIPGDPLGGLFVSVQALVGGLAGLRAAHMSIRLDDEHVRVAGSFELTGCSGTRSAAFRSAAGGSIGESATSTFAMDGLSRSRPWRTAISAAGSGSIGPWQSCHRNLVEGARSLFRAAMRRRWGVMWKSPLGRTL